MYEHVTINAWTRYETFCLVKLFILLVFLYFPACLSTIMVNEDEYIILFYTAN